MAAYRYQNDICLHQNHLKCLQLELEARYTTNDLAAFYLYSRVFSLSFFSLWLMTLFLLFDTRIETCLHRNRCLVLLLHIWQCSTNSLDCFRF